MKLYATVTSERASKGQGGNKYIEVKINDDKKMPIYELAILPDSEGWLFIENGSARILKKQGGGYDVDIREAITRLLVTKGETVVLSPKNDCKHLITQAVYNGKELRGYSCNHCGKLVPVNPAYQKGKKQKGEICYQEHKSGKYGGCSIPHYHD